MIDPPLYLIRHAKAGDRSAWTEDDRLRPLSKRGRRQAEALVRRFRGLALDRVISSSSLRCEQTVRPLAIDRGLRVEHDDALAEGAPLDEALELLDKLDSEPSVLCSHGDVIPMLVTHLASGGLRIEGEREWKKASTWILERADGVFVRGHYLPPPDPS